MKKYVITVSVSEVFWYVAHGTSVSGLHTIYFYLLLYCREIETRKGNWRVNFSSFHLPLNKFQLKHRLFLLSKLFFNCICRKKKKSRSQNVQGNGNELSAASILTNKRKFGHNFAKIHF